MPMRINKSACTAILPLLVAFSLTGCNKTTDQVAAQPAATAQTNTATSADMTPEQHKQAREQVMKDWKKASQAMGEMVKNPASFNAEAFRQQVATLKQEPWGHWGADTKGGDSKDTIWSDAAGFEQEITKYKQAVNALDTAAATATSSDAVSSALQNVGASCKSCHQAYRN